MNKNDFKILAVPDWWMEYIYNCLYFFLPTLRTKEQPDFFKVLFLMLY